MLAAGLNVLPGIGNFYLACGAGGRPDHWLWGAANLLLWPISIAWAVPEGYVDAERINDLALLGCLDMQQGLRSSAEPVENTKAAPSPRIDGPVEPPERPPYEIVGIAPMDGNKYVVRVKVGDKSRLFEVLRVVKPDVVQLIRDDFGMRNASISVERIRYFVQYRTEEDGTYLVFTGWAFSVQPVADGWGYDPESQKGTLRLRISDGMPPEEAKRWAHENIAEIVQYKNVALATDKAPPPGAKYRSLSESFENGVLTVEFEAVQ